MTATTAAMMTYGVEEVLADVPQHSREGRPQQVLQAGRPAGVLTVGLQVVHVLRQRNDANSSRAGK